MPDTHQWMTYPPTGGTNRFPVEAVKDWAARGWEPCEAPPEPDPTNTVLIDGVESDGPAGELLAAEDTTSDTAGLADSPATNPDTDDADNAEEAVTHG